MRVLAIENGRFEIVPGSSDEQQELERAARLHAVSLQPHPAFESASCCDSADPSRPTGASV